MGVETATCSDTVTKHLANFDCAYYKLFITTKAT